MSLRESGIVISMPLRTAIGTFGGMLKDTPAAELGATVVSSLLGRTSLRGEQIDQVIVGNVLQAGQGMNPARQVTLKAGLPVGVPAMTVNRVCGSGLQAIVSAPEDVALGEADVIVAGGIGDMGRAPVLLPKARHGHLTGLPSAQLGRRTGYARLWER